MRKKDKLAEEFMKFHVAISRRNLNLLETVRKEAINQLEKSRASQKQNTSCDAIHDDCQNKKA